MSSSEARPASATFLVGVYAAIFALMAIVYLAINYFFQLEMATIGFVITAAAAMTMARNWVMREQTAPASARIWKISVLCVIVTIIFFAAIGGLGVATNQHLMREIEYNGPMLIAGVAGILFLISLFIIRISLWIGIKQAIKQVNAAKLKAQ
ncbi:ABZJ_00895 family protein [Paenochrobactrum sp. BZR 588]|uniref:ABZJ_00895 family protein n=1 Tax=Paenochrobactrum TaxID=999488 RepID=UPI0035BBC48A